MAPVISVDLTGVWFGCQAALRQLIRQGQGGRIINISSRLAIQGVAPGRADYCAAKGGVSSLTRQLAVEAGPHGVAVNAICPGFIVTDATREVALAGKLEEMRRRTPYHRAGDARGRGGMRGLPRRVGVGVRDRTEPRRRWRRFDRGLTPRRAR